MSEAYISEKEAYGHMGFRGESSSAISQMMKKLRAKGLKSYGITDKRRRYLKSDIDAFIAGSPSVEETHKVINSTIRHAEETGNFRSEFD